MSRHMRYDALVVGARCAGAATAMLMARNGLRVLVIERGAYGTDTLSTHALMRGGVLQLQHWGVLPRIVAAGTPAVRHTIFQYGEDVLKIDLKQGPGGDALYAPRRTVLDRVLVDAAREAGAEVRYGHALTGLMQRRDGRITGAVVLDRNGDSHEIAADLVVGADGLGSAVARLVQAPMLREGRHASAALYGHRAGLAESGYRWYYRPGASAGIIPTNDGLHCVFVATPARRFREQGRHDPAVEYRRVLAEVSADLAAEIATSRLQGRMQIFAGRRGFLRKASGPGWALVGDAGYFKDPLTAHGMTDALRDAALLAAAAGHGGDASFANYESTRNLLSLPFFEATDAIASFAWDLEAARQHHQALSAAMKQEVEYLATMNAADRNRQFTPSKPISHEEKAA